MPGSRRPPAFSSWSRRCPPRTSSGRRTARVERAGRAGAPRAPGRELATGESNPPTSSRSRARPGGLVDQAGVTERRGRQPAEVLAEYRDGRATRRRPGERLPDDEGKPERTRGSGLEQPDVAAQPGARHLGAQQDIRRATDHPAGSRARRPDRRGHLLGGLAVRACRSGRRPRRDGSVSCSMGGAKRLWRQRRWPRAATGPAEADVPDDPEGIDDADAVISLNRGTDHPHSAPGGGRPMISRTPLCSAPASPVISTWPAGCWQASTSLLKPPARAHVLGGCEPCVSLPGPSPAYDPDV